MAKKVILKERGTNEEMYPVTLIDNVIGANLKILESIDNIPEIRILRDGSMYLKYPQDIDETERNKIMTNIVNGKYSLICASFIEDYADGDAMFRTILTKKTSPWYGTIGYSGVNNLYGSFDNLILIITISDLTIDHDKWFNGKYSCEYLVKETSLNQLSTKVNNIKQALVQKIEKTDWYDIYTTPYDVHIVLKGVELYHLPGKITEPIELDVTYSASTILWDEVALTVYEGLNKNVYLHENISGYNTYKLYLYNHSDYEREPCNEFYWGREILEANGSYKGNNNNLSLNIIGVKMDPTIFKLKQV